MQVVFVGIFFGGRSGKTCMNTFFFPVPGIYDTIQTISLSFLHDFPPWKLFPVPAVSIIPFFASLTKNITLHTDNQDPAPHTTNNTGQYRFIRTPASRFTPHLVTNMSNEGSLSEPAVCHFLFYECTVCPNTRVPIHHTIYVLPIRDITPNESHP